MKKVLFRYTESESRIGIFRIYAVSGKRWVLSTKNIEPQGFSHLEEEYAFLEEIGEKLANHLSYQDKLLIVDGYPQVKLFFSSHPLLTSHFSDLPLEKIFVLKVAVLLGQAHIFDQLEEVDDLKMRLNLLLGELWQVEYFYKQLGGLVGYQKMIVKLMIEHQTGVTPDVKVAYEPPETIDLSQDSKEVRKAVITAIKHLDHFAESYPIGGAGDRLGLRDERGNGLPAAKLKFLGRTLLEGMIRDLAAREYLFFGLYRRQIDTPVLLMTSREKDNHNYVRLICNQQNWFGRKKSEFFFITQPLVPACDVSGRWIVSAPLKLLGKPNGHGALLHLAKQKGGYDWIRAKERDYIFFRQVNNPVAGIDNGLLAFIGMGYLQKKEFGFAACERRDGAKEGMNVIKKMVQGPLSKVALSNIEYCDLKSEDLLAQKGDGKSFPANTNMLFMKLDSLQKAVTKCPFPGLLINYKPIEVAGRTIEVARLESTMQNIADAFEEFNDQPIEKKEQSDLKAYITINRRRKTISAIKKSFHSLEEWLETPEACYYDLLINAKELLENYLHFQVPPIPSPADFLANGPSFLFFYHPALGPLYQIIAQKIRKGSMAPWAECNLEIADVDIENLHLDGSLTVTTMNVMGHFNDKGELIYSNRTGKCTLHNVQVKNRGLVREMRPKFWKNRWKRDEECLIELEENAEFIAKNITFSASHHIRVPKNERWEAVQKEDGSIKLIKTALHKEEPFWKYRVDGNYNIILSR